MKKLLSLAILVVGLVVISYAVSHHKKAPAPAPVIVQTPAEVIEQEHSTLLPEPKAPDHDCHMDEHGSVCDAPYTVTPTDPKLAPAVIPTPKPRVVQKKKPHHVKAPRPQQYVLPPPQPASHCFCKA